MLLNTGTELVPSKSGLLTTVGWKLGDAAGRLLPRRRRSRSRARWCSGCATTWASSARRRRSKRSPRTVDDNGGAYFVPAFSGLFAPYWRGDARGVIVGLTRYVNKGHLARATLEATAWQTREVLDAMEADSGVTLKELKVDGGMVYNELLMQFQADCLEVPVIRPKVAETTALGAAYAAGLAVGFWEVHRRAPPVLGQGQGVDAPDADGQGRQRVRQLEEGRHPHVRLGRLTGRPTPTFRGTRERHGQGRRARSGARRASARGRFRRGPGAGRASTN